MNLQNSQFFYENRLFCYITSSDLIVLKMLPFFKKNNVIFNQPFPSPSFFLYAFSVDFCATHAKSNESRYTMYIVLGIYIHSTTML